MKRNTSAVGIDRRTFLGGLSAGGAAAIAGCTTGLPGGGDGEELMDESPVASPEASWASSRDDSQQTSLTLTTEQAKFVAPDSSPENIFGLVMAVDDETALIGAAGAAYVFTRSGGQWTQQAKLTNEEENRGDGFGYAVSLDGDTAIVGDMFDKNQSGNSIGAAYVFTRSEGEWTRQAKLVASDGAGDDYFGSTVTVDGDFALISALRSGDPDSGTVYVFTRSGGQWTQRAKLTASDSSPDSYFGSAVAVVGDVLFVGAPSTGSEAERSGSVYAFTWSDGEWTQQAKLVASDSSPGELFGSAVSGYGNTVLIGAPGDNSTAFRSGSAYVFVRSGGRWTQQAKLTASDGLMGDIFGASVSVNDGVALVGAPLSIAADEVLGRPETANWSGSAYAFARSGTRWTQQAKLTASDGEKFDRFGMGVAVDDDIALIGAPVGEIQYGEDAKAGSVYVFEM